MGSERNANGLVCREGGGADTRKMPTRDFECYVWGHGPRGGPIAAGGGGAQQWRRWWRLDLVLAPQT